MGLGVELRGQPTGFRERVLTRIPALLRSDHLGYDYATAAGSATATTTTTPATTTTTGTAVV